VTDSKRRRGAVAGWQRVTDNLHLRDGIPGRVADAVASG
jgi:hypothetical protein